MNLDWIKNEQLRAIVGADLILYGSAYVKEELIDGTVPMHTRVDPRNVRVLSHFQTGEDGRTAGCPTTHGYEVTCGGKTAIYEPSDIWHGRLVVQGD